MDAASGRKMEKFKRRVADTLGYDLHYGLSSGNRLLNMPDIGWLRLWLSNGVSHAYGRFMQLIDPRTVGPSLLRLQW